MENNLDKFLNDILKSEVKISSEKGGFNLFALFKSEIDTLNWDLVISAEWLNKGSNKKDIEIIVTFLKNKLNPFDLHKISRIITVKSNEPFVKNIVSAMKIEHSIIKIENSNLNGVLIKEGVIFTSM